MDWTTSLAEQIDWHWTAQARPRLDGLTDHEYFWEPVAGLLEHPASRRGGAMPVGTGDFTIDFDFPEPSPPPVTTIAWRLGHVIVGVLGDRNARYFDGPAVSYADFDYPGIGRAITRRAGRASTRGGSAASGPRRRAAGRPCGRARASRSRRWPSWCCTSTAS